MRVWIVEPVGYDMYGIDGVFASLEAAKESRPRAEWEKREYDWISADADAVSGHGARIYEDEVRGA
jgi:hypothetical protein